MLRRRAAVLLTLACCWCALAAKGRAHYLGWPRVNGQPHPRGCEVLPPKNRQQDQVSKGGANIQAASRSRSFRDALVWASAQILCRGVCVAAELGTVL